MGLLCCVGAKRYSSGNYFPACKNFNGKLYNNSCNGAFACCVDANIQTVKNGCKDDTSCFRAGFVGGVGNMIDSCNCNGGFTACSYLAEHADMTRSCNSDSACYRQGVIATNTNMYECCNTRWECEYANQATLPANCTKVSLPE